MVINRVRDVDEAVRWPTRAATRWVPPSSPERVVRKWPPGCGPAWCPSIPLLSFAAVPALPFGGSGDSGFGRIHGEDGLREFARPQSVTRQRFRPMLRPMSFSRGGRTVRRLLRLVRLRYGR